MKRMLQYGLAAALAGSALCYNPARQGSLETTVNKSEAQTANNAEERTAQAVDYALSLENELYDALCNSDIRRVVKTYNVARATLAGKEGPELDHATRSLKKYDSLVVTCRKVLGVMQDARKRVRQGESLIGLDESCILELRDMSYPELSPEEDDGRRRAGYGILGTYERMKRGESVEKVQNPYLCEVEE